jgi:hypothetical protein
MKVLAWFIDPNGIENKSNFKHPYPIGIKECQILNIDTRMISKKRIPGQHIFGQDRSLSALLFLFNK